MVKTLPSFTHRRYNKAGMDGKQHPKLPKLTSRKSDLPKNRGEPENRENPFASSHWARFKVADIRTPKASISLERRRPMSAKPFQPDRAPLRRLGSIALIIGLLGLLAIIYTMVKYVQDRTTAEEWMLWVGFCLIFGSLAASLVQGVLRNHRARIEALEKRADRDGTQS